MPEMPEVTTFEECPACHMTIFRIKSDGTRECCNRHCRHEWQRPQVDDPVPSDNIVFAAEKQK